MDKKEINRLEWIISKLEEYEGDKNIVNTLYKNFIKETKSDVSLESYKRYVRQARDYYLNKKVMTPQESEFQDEDYVKLSAQKQKLMDKNRVVNKSLRENYRVYNLMEELVNEYRDLISNLGDFSQIKIKKHKNKYSKYGIIHISDWHLGLKVGEEEQVGNVYNLNIASKRFKKLVSSATHYFKSVNVTDVVIINTGDTITSSRRLSEKLSQASSLTSASLIGVSLLSQAIQELMQEGFKVTYGSVCGNESRINSDFYENENILLLDNFDYMINESIYLLFKDNKNFNIIEGSPKEKIFTLTDKKDSKKRFTGVITHGENFSQNPDKKAREYISKFTLDHGIRVNSIFSGHYHSPLCTSGGLISRSACLSGADSYSNKKLNYKTRASQNLYIVNDDYESYTGMVIDLQNVDDVKEGYDIQEELTRNFVYENNNNNKSNTRLTLEYLV